MVIVLWLTQPANIGKTTLLVFWIPIQGILPGVPMGKTFVLAAVYFQTPGSSALIIFCWSHHAVFELSLYPPQKSFSISLASPDKSLVVPKESVPNLIQR